MWFNAARTPPPDRFSRLVKNVGLYFLNAIGEDQPPTG
jgi:hypothetical protein